MKTIGKHEDIARITGTGLALAALFAMVLLSPSAGRAQSRASSPPIAAATPAKAAPALQPAAASGAKPGGNHEGITVHGHWVIEVKNPDGTVTARREFENSLASNGGATLLAGLLTGTVTPGSWWVYLAEDNSGNGAIVIAQANSSAAAVCQLNIQNQEALFQVCFNTLSVTGSQLESSGGSQMLSGSTMTLTGSATLPTNAPAETIAWVETASAVCLPSNSPSACVDASLTGGASAGIVPLTARNLGDGVGSDPPSVPVSPGQAISVSVVISFGSGS